MSVVEGWASLDAWDGDTDLFSTAGGRLLPRGGDGTLPIITRSLRLPAGRRFRLVGSLSRTARGWGLIGVEGTEDTWAIGVNDDPGEIIGVRLSDFWQPSLGLELGVGDEVSIAIVGDELGVSFAVTTDDARVASMWQPWSEIGDVEAIWIVAGDPDAAMWIGPLGVDDAGATIAPRDGIEGLRPTAIEVRTSPEAAAAGERAIVMLPATFDSTGEPVPAVIHCHGATQDAHEIFGGGTIATRPVAEAMLAQGWIVCGGDFAGDSFGNPAAVRWVNELAVWLDGHLPIRARALTSDSMGGLVALNTIASRIHDWVGWVGWEPATNLHSDDPDWWATSSVGEWMGDTFRAAYGIAPDWSDLAERAGPHDPIRRRPEAYAGLQAALWASYDDGVADRADNADAFAAHVADVADVEVRYASGNHNNPSHYQPAAVVAFLLGVFADGPGPGPGSGQATLVAHRDSGGWLADVRSVTIEIPAEARDNDVLVVTGYTEADVGPSGALLDGWLPSAAVAPWGEQWWHFTWVLPRDAITTGLIDWGGETTWAAWRVEVIRGATADAPSISTGNGFGTDITAPSVNAQQGGVLIWVVATDSARPSITPPPGMELIGSVTPWGFAIVAAEEAATDGPTGPRTGTWPEPTGWTATLIAIAPVADPDPPDPDPVPAPEIVPAGASDDVTIRLQALDGTWETCGVDRAIGVVPESVTFAADEWGPSTASFELRRRPDAIWPDLGSFAPVVIEIGGVVRWRGRTGETPISDGAAPSISIQCRGLQHHLDEDAYRRTFIHSRLADWRDQRSMLTARLGANANYAAGQVTHDGGITLTMPDAQPLVVGTCVGVVLDLGPLGDRAASIVLEVEGSANTSNNGFYVRTTDTEDWGHANAHSDAYTGTINDLGRSRIITNHFPSPQRYVHLFIWTNTAYTPNGDVWVKIKRCFVCTHTAWRAGQESALTASAVVRDALDNATMLLSPDRSQIAETAFPLPELAPTRFASAREMIEGVNAWHNWLCQVDLADRMVFRPRPAVPLIEVGSWSGAEFTDAANDGAQLYNRVVVDGRDGAGQPVVVERAAGEVADVTTTVGVPQPSNPSFDVDTRGWEIWDGGERRSGRTTAVFDTPPASLRIDGGLFPEAWTTIAGPFRAGQPVTASAWVYAPAPVRASLGLEEDPWLEHGDRVWVAVIAGAPRRVSVTLTPRRDLAAVRLRVGIDDPSGALYVDTVRISRSVGLLDRRHTRRTKVLEPTHPITPAGGQQLADVFLRAHMTTPLRGDLTVMPGGARMVLGGAPVHPSALIGLTGERIRLSHRIDPDTGAVGRTGVIANVVYTHADRRAQVSLDDPRRNFDAMAKRLESLQGAG